MRAPRLASWLRAGTVAALIVSIGLVAFWLAGRRSPPPPAPTATAPPASTAPPAADSAPSAPAFVNDRLRREIESEGLTVDRARQLFVLEVTTLPGVTAPAGQVSPTLSGTYALTQLMAVRDQLTPEQQARLARLLDVTRSTLPPDARPMTPVPLPPPYQPPSRQPSLRQPSATPPSLPAPAPAPASAADAFAARQPPLRIVRASMAVASSTAAATAATTATAADDAPTVDEQYRAYFRPLYHWANNAVAALTGEPLVPGFVLSFDTLDGPDWVLSWAWDSGERVRATVDGTQQNVCASQIDVGKFQNQTVDAQLSVIVHEVMHCYQQLASPSAAAVKSTHGWLHDGEATWAQMAIVTSAVFPALQNHWAEYLDAPTVHLFQRKYDAAGFYGHLADVTNDAFVAGRLIPAFKAGASGNDQAGYDTLVAGVEDTLLDTWAPSYFRAHASSFLWTVKGPGAGNFPSTPAAPVALTVGPDETMPLGPALKWELSLVRLDSSADIVSIASGRGHLALIDKSNQVNRTLAPFEPIALCLKGDCKCPPDAEGEVPPALAAQAPIDIGLTGGTTGAWGWAHGVSLDDYCRRRILPPGPSPPVGAGGGDLGGGEPTQGVARSEPHIVTLDGRAYDLQALGEFVLAKSTRDAFQVQVRFGPFAQFRSISTPTAMATRVGDDRVTVTLDRSGSGPIALLRINGQRVTDSFTLLAGGSVRAVFSEGGTGYTIAFADGTKVGVSPFVGQGLNVWIVPSAARHGALTGLLGDDDGNRANDPVTAATATVLPEAPTYDELYTAFGNSWRIAAADSLFDYAPGESTATFTDLAFPDRHAPGPDAAAMTQAETACKAGGIVDALLLRHCAFDLAVTGERAFVRAYRPVQRRAEAIETLRGNGTVTAAAPSARTRSVLLEGRVADVAADAVASFEGFKGDIIYLAPENCLKPRFLQMRGPDGRQVGGMAPQCGLRLPLPSTGTYQFVLNPFHDFTGIYRLPVTVVRPDRQTPLTPGDVMTGTLAARAEQDVFLVTMKGPGAITIGGEGCEASFDIAVYYGDDELVGAGPACRIGQIKLPKAGTYRIVTNPFSAAAGSYRVPTS